DSVTLKSLAPRAGTLIYLLGEAKSLAWSQQGADIKITLPRTLPGQYAYVLKIAGPLSMALNDSPSSETRQRYSLSLLGYEAEPRSSSCVCPLVRRNNSRAKA